MRRILLSGLLALCVGLPFTSEGVAQELPPKVQLPPPSPGPCETDEVLAFLERGSTPEGREESRNLLSEANQAAILGEDDRARALLLQAAELDPTESEVAYRLGRLLESAGEEEAALLEFCRYLVLDPDGPDVPDVEFRVEELAGPEEDEIPGIARIAFQQGVSALEREEFEASALHFSRALVELPNWPDAHYNRGLAYLKEGRVGAGRADLERYLELAPDAPDESRVSERLAQLAPAPATRQSPGTALFTGIVFPGMGQFYTGRTGTGLLVLAGAGAGIAAALLVTEVELSCRVPPVDGVCPPSEVADRTEERPLLVPGLAAAGAITLLGAIHAFRVARSGSTGLAVAEGPGVRLGITPLSGDRWESSFELEPLGRWGADGVEASLRIRF